MAEELKVSHLVRDKKYILSNLDMSKNIVYTKKDTTITIPKRYTLKNMAFIGEDNYVIGVLPIIMDNKYSVMSVMSLISLGDSILSEVTYQETEYLQFQFEKGSVLFKDTSVVRDDNISYDVFSEFINQGNIPWFLDYLDVAKVYQTSDIYADSKMSSYTIPFEILVSLIHRSPKERLKLYRYLLNKEEDLSIKPDIVPLKSVAYMSKSTLNKIAGSYMSEGIESSLVYPSQKVEHIEKLLRE